MHVMLLPCWISPYNIHVSIHVYYIIDIIIYTHRYAGGEVEIDKASGNEWGSE